ncbi:MAG TPA: alpha/beta family hydrolase [Acidimicrobiales bacterium]|nr:alpha/beta family hydrolase [Acidimicrobiales bacterium]
MLLAPGAGAGRDQPQLVAIDRAAAAAGATVERIDFPYRQAGRRAPDRPPVLLATVADAARRLPRPLVAGGRSMGGRIASMAVADGLVDAAALVLVSYPLHPVGRPDRRRVEHLPRIAVPCLFVSGTRDAMGSPVELEEAAAAVAAPVTFHWVEGRDHGLRGADAEVASVVVGWLRGLGLLADGDAPR